MKTQISTPYGPLDVVPLILGTKYIAGRAAVYQSKCPGCGNRRIGPEDMFINHRLCHPCEMEQADQISVDDVLDIREDYKHIMDLDYEAQGQPENNYHPYPNTVALVKKLVKDYAERLEVDEHIVKNIIYWRSHQFVDTSMRGRKR